MRSLLLAIILTLIFSIFIAAVKPSLGADFSKDTIYMIVVDRFCDGDPSINPPEKIFSRDKSQWKLYWGGDIQGIIDKLPYIKRLGCNVIWITPIMKNTDSLYVYGKNGQEKMAAYHGYWGEDFYRINPYFGSEEKYRELVDKAHKMGIKVVFDMVLNHTSPEGQGVNGALYKKGEFIADYSKDPESWFHHNGSIDFSKKITEKEWQDKNLFDLADLNSENPAVRQYLFDAAKMWMDTGIDGFRLDTVRHIPESLAAEFTAEVLKKRPDMFIFGEWSMGGLNIAESVNFSKNTGVNLIDFQFTYALTDVLCRNKPFTRLSQYIENDSKIKNPNLLVTCIDNHDMPRFISSAIEGGCDTPTALKRSEMATYIMMTSRGIPCIYYGTEQYLHLEKKSTWGFGGEPYNRQMMTGWNNFNEFSKNIKKLALMRKNIPAASRGIHHTLLADDTVWVFERRCGKSVILVAVNKGKKRKISVDGITLPQGRYDNKNPGRRQLLGPDISVKHGKSLIDLKENCVGVWFCR